MKIAKLRALIDAAAKLRQAPLCENTEDPLLSLSELLRPYEREDLQAFVERLRRLKEKH